VSKPTRKVAFLYTRQERLDRDKRSSLLGPVVSYEYKEYDTLSLMNRVRTYTYIGTTTRGSICVDLGFTQIPEAVFLVVCDPSMNQL
jgi:hypothetical protein